MNDYHLMTLANERVAQQRAEADRFRLARSARSRTTTRSRSARARQARRFGVSQLSALFLRVVQF